MSSTDLEKAHDFLRGVATSDPDLATRHIDPDVFTDHYPPEGGDAFGLCKRVGEGPVASADATVVRSVCDDPLLVVQHDAGEPGRTAAFDVFRFDRGMIVERWAFVAADGTPNLGGHTQADGPVEPRHPEDTDRNKAIFANTTRPSILPGGTKRRVAGSRRRARWYVTSPASRTAAKRSSTSPVRCPLMAQFTRAAVRNALWPSPHSSDSESHVYDGALFGGNVGTRRLSAPYWQDSAGKADVPFPYRRPALGKSATAHSRAYA